MLQDPDRGRGGERAGGDLRPEELAAELVARKAAGEAVDVEGFAARLEGEAQRAELRELVAAAGEAERGLPRALASGSLIAGRYRIRETLGAGGMGKVFAAVDEKLRRPVAVKVLAPLAQGNREREEMFAKESRILADLKHPGIVAVHDAGSDGPFTYIVMDLVEGTAISDVIDRARRELERAARGPRLPARDGRALARAIGREPAPGRSGLIEEGDWYRSSARIVTEIARTLEAAHERKVIHRDLKPANVMLLGGGQPVVLDFGLAGSPDFSTEGVTEGLYGSVAYLAPEQSMSQKVGMDPRTDVYQVGLVLYEMLTLRRAFPGTAIGEVLSRIELGEYPAPRKLDPAVPRDLEAICTMALELSPEKRYPSARALREDLERWLDGRAPVASRSARWRSLVRTARYAARRRPLLTALGGMIVVGAAIYTWRRISEPIRVPTRVNFFRIGPHDSKPVPIDPNKPTVKPEDCLGFTLVQSEGAVVYALSIFRRKGKGLYVAPWCATDPEHLELLDDQESRPWGWAVTRPVDEIVCTRVEPDKLGELNDWEGLIVLVSPTPRPEFESWRKALAKMVGETGVPYDRALRVLQEGEPTTRGVPPPKSWKPREFESVQARLIEARQHESRRFGLPGVDDYSVECEVDKGDSK
jgi:serine/threonine protein kinase